MQLASILALTWNGGSSDFEDRRSSTFFPKPLPLSSSASPPSLTLLEVRSNPPSISPLLESSLSSSQLHCTYIHQFLEGSVPPCYPDRAPFQFPPANPSSILTSHDHPKASPIRSLEGPRAPYLPRLPPSARPPASRSPATRAGVRALQPQKRGRAKLQSVLKTSDTGYPDLLQYQPTSSSYGCLSSLKKKRSRGNMPRAVGNRTPQLTVASKYQRDDNIRPANRRAKPNATNGDDEGAHVAVLALAVVCQRGGSPQVSQLPRRSSYHKTSALDALHTLANRSVNILQPSSSAVTELSAHIKGSKDNESSEKPSVPAAVPLFKKNVNSSKKKKINRLSEIASNDMVTRKNARLMKDPDHDGSTISEVVEQQDPHHDGSAISEVEALDTMDTIQNALSQNSDSMSKARSQHTLGILKALAPECKPSEGADDSCDNFTYPVNSIVDLKDKPSHCLSSRPPRRWCMSEWCCTAIDYPWFAKSDFFAEYPNYVKLGQESAKSEFVEYSNHVKLGHGPKLARVEWGVIRSSFGKPRRFSKQFLKEEREKLSQYRESVGQHYAELQSGVREGLPRAIACHPKTRALPDGSVLTVDRDRCRVLQIDDGSELTRGFEFVMGTNMQREVTHLRQKIMCEVNSSRVNIRDLPGYLLANEW